MKRMNNIGCREEENMNAKVGSGEQKENGCVKRRTISSPKRVEEEEKRWLKEETEGCSKCVSLKEKSVANERVKASP